VTLSKGFVFSAGVNIVCTFIHTKQRIHDMKLHILTGWSPDKPVSNINGELLIFLVTTWWYIDCFYCKAVLLLTGSILYLVTIF